METIGARLQVAAVSDDVRLGAAAQQRQRGDGREGEAGEEDGEGASAAVGFPALGDDQIVAGQPRAERVADALVVDAVDREDGFDHAHDRMLDLERLVAGDRKGLDREAGEDGGHMVGELLVLDMDEQLRRRLAAAGLSRGVDADIDVGKRRARHPAQGDGIDQAVAGALHPVPAEGGPLGDEFVIGDVLPLGGDLRFVEGVAAEGRGAEADEQADPSYVHV